MKLNTVFLWVLINGSVCFGEEWTFSGNWALGN